MMKDGNKMKDKYDAIVVGGGHNELTATGYLGRAGLNPSFRP
jgi:thioredoxin reductase